jgi:hypothetical protein
MMLSLHRELRSSLPRFVPRPTLRILAPLALLAASTTHAHGAAALVQSVTVSAAPDAVSVADFQSRIQSLDKLVAQCQSAITPANCSSSQVGPDLQLTLPTGSRQIRFAWLRNLLDAASDSSKKSKDDPKSKASEDEDAQTAPSRPTDFRPPTLIQQLADARQRLAEESRLAASRHATPAATPQRQTLDRILAQKEFHPAIAGPSLIDRAFEKVGNWIDTVIGRLEQAGFKSRWVGRTAEILFVLALTIAIVWFFIRLERQGRLAAAQFLPGTGGAAASARDWQLWLEDARRAASQSAWRDAIHLLYWASISRLESHGFWPADRARTPREYLALLTQENAHHADLKALTRSFERTWYAGRPAAESDFRQAAEVAAKLGASLSSQSSSPSGAR